MLFFHLTLAVPSHAVRDTLQCKRHKIGGDICIYIYECCLPNNSNSTLPNVTAVLLLYRYNLPQSLLLFHCSISNTSFLWTFNFFADVLQDIGLYFIKLQVTLLLFVPNFRKLKPLACKVTSLPKSYVLLMLYFWFNDCLCYHSNIIQTLSGLIAPGAVSL